jgi:hypothetical protein
MNLKFFTTLKSYYRDCQSTTWLTRVWMHTDGHPTTLSSIDWFTTLKSYSWLPVYNFAHTALNSHWLTSYHFELHSLNDLQLWSHTADWLSTTLLTQLWIHTDGLSTSLSYTTWLNLECSFPSMSLPWKSPNQNIPSWSEHLHYKATETNLKWERCISILPKHLQS